MNVKLSVAHQKYNNKDLFFQSVGTGDSDSSKCSMLQFGGCSPGTPVSSANKTVSHDITELLLKVMLNTISHKP